MSPTFPGFQTHTAVPGLYVGAGNLSYGPHASIASSLPMEPSLNLGRSCIVKLD